MRRENRRHKAAEAASVETNNAILAGHEWKSIAEHREEKLKIKDENIDSLYLQIGEWRDKHNELLTKLNERDIVIAQQSSRICNVPGCVKRDPPSLF